MTKFKKLANAGQSVWYDFIRRDIILNGTMQSLINKGIRGITSNPSIFDKAISGSTLYDLDVKEFLNNNISPIEMYEKIALKDIKLAAEKMLSIYVKTNRLDGYVSIEVNPNLAYDTEKTIVEGKRLFNQIGLPNIMIKVPATQEGLPAVTELIAAGINVNVTLIFSMSNYIDVAEAYISGLEKLLKKGNNFKKVASVASFFVSRVDTAVDKELEKIGNKELQGKIAVANSKLSYKEFNKILDTQRWEHLSAKGANIQRLLWASTSTKNPKYSDILYVQELIGKQTVNTMPPATIDNFIDHGNVEETLTKNVDVAEEQIKKLSELGINLEEITAKLQVDGVKAFSDSFKSLLLSIEEKMLKFKEL